jgi:predicted acetyltransferase
VHGVLVVTETMVTLDPITKDQAHVLRNLFELYAYDFSEHVALELKPTGRFEVPLGDEWWATAGHFPFFVRCDGKLCGFALVRCGSRLTAAADVMDIAEFFILRGARRKRVGEQAAHALFAAFPGKWEIRVRRTNSAASEFWSRAVASWTGRPAKSTAYAVDGVEWEVLRIEPAES